MYVVSLSALLVALLVTALLAAGLGFAVGRSHPADPAADPDGAALDAALRAVEAQLLSTERERAAGQAALHTEVALMRSSSEALRQETASLATALRAPAVRGRWGETQLRRVLELGGALEHCDFQEQQVLQGGSRPDVVVRLAGGKQLVIDAKVPMEAFLASTEAPTDIERRQLRRDHARQLRAHIATLAARSYWAGLEGSPEFVVLFLPGEAFLDAALQADPTLLEAAFASNVVVATPATLLTLIRTIAYTWRQEHIADGAREIATLGRDLHERLSTMSRHLVKLGASLRGSVEAYNATLASLEARVLPSARRLSHRVGDPGLPPLLPVETPTRPLTAPELLLDIRPSPDRDDDDETGGRQPAVA